MTLSYVGIGTNLGAREEHLAFSYRALAALRTTELLRCSRPFESVAVGPGAQPHYLNAVAEIETALTPRALLEALLEIEAQRGRVRGLRWGPRVLDLDLLLYGDRWIDEPGLCVPHPRMTERNFVMEPLADLAPSLVVGGRRVDTHVKILKNDDTLWEFFG